MNRDLISIVAGRFFQAAVSLLLLKLLTNFLSPPQVAIYYSVVAVSSVAAIFLVNGPSLWIQRNLYQWRNEYSASSLFNQYLGLFTLSTVVAFALIGGVKNLSGDRFLPLISYRTLLIGLLSGICGQFLYYTLSMTQNTLGSRPKYGLLMSLGQVLILIFTGGIFLFGSATAEQWFLFSLLGYVAGSILFAGNIWFEFRGKETLRFRKTMKMADYKRIVIPYLAIGLATWIPTQGYRIVFNSAEKANLLAYLAVGFGLANNMGNVIESLIQQYFGPVLLREKGGGFGNTETLWRDNFLTIVMLLAAGAAALIGLAPLLLKAFTSQTYSAAIRFLQWGIVFEFFRILVSFTNFLYFLEDRMPESIRGHFEGALVTVSFYLLSFFFAGFEGASVAAGAITGCIVTLKALLKKVEIPLSFSTLIRNFAAGIALGMPICLFGFIFNPRYDFFSFIELTAVATYLCWLGQKFKRLRVEKA